MKSPSSRLDGDLRGRQNRARLLQEIRHAGPISRRGLHERTGTRPNTVGDIVGGLIAEGLVEEVGAAAGKRGRRRQLLALAARGTVLGAELFESAVRVGALDLHGTLREFTEHPLPTRSRAPVIETLVKALRALARTGKILGAGVAVAGVLDSERGISRRIAGFRDWRDVPLAARLRRTLRVPVHLGNLTDVRLIDLKHRGLIGPEMTAALAVLEPGAVGCGIVTGGQVLRGAVEASSELGHTKVMPDGPRCHCGGRGCLEALTDWSFLRREIRRRGGRSPADLAAFLASRDADVVTVRDELAARLGTALANLVHLIKPSHLWLTGSLAAPGSPLMKTVVRALRRNLLPSFDEALNIETLDHAPQDGVRGAGGLVLDRLFAVPEVRYF